MPPPRRRPQPDRPADHHPLARHHYGGMAELEKRIPIREYMDHGPNQHPAEAPDEIPRRGLSVALCQGKHTVLKRATGSPCAHGDQCRHFETARRSRTGRSGRRQPNPACAVSSRARTISKTRSPSASTSVSAASERSMSATSPRTGTRPDCPTIRSGRSTCSVGLHHGQVTSHSPVIVHALAPRVGIMNNARAKAASPETMMVLASSPGFEVCGRSISRR